MPLEIIFSKQKWTIYRKIAYVDYELIEIDQTNVKRIQK